MATVPAGHYDGDGTRLRNRNAVNDRLQRGFVVWFTGLSGAGKSTIADLVARNLELDFNLIVDQLDGDVLRTHLSSGLGFSKVDRDVNVARVGWVASRLARAGAAVLVSMISPYGDARGHARRMVEEHSMFIEVHVATPLEECVRRDPKGLYAKAFAGQLPEFTGVSDPYEVPDEPELRLSTQGRTPAESAGSVLRRLVELQRIVDYGDHEIENYVPRKAFGT
jgi:adenylyl-sulfate kinase